MERLGMQEDERIEHRWVNKAIENAQKKVEGHNFDIRKHLLEYDDVMNQQRKTIYSLRKQVLEGRYAPDLTDEEKKAGKQAEVPTQSGEWTTEKLAETLRPRIKQILDEFFAGLKQGDVDPYRAGADAEPGPGEVNHEELTRELYRYFGAMVDLQSESKDPKACLDKAMREVAESLIQQRERVLDLSDASISAHVFEHCPEKVHPEEWEMNALEEKLKPPPAKEEKPPAAPASPFARKRRSAMLEKARARIVMRTVPTDYSDRAAVEVVELVSKFVDCDALSSRPGFFVDHVSP